MRLSLFITIPILLFGAISCKSAREGDLSQHKEENRFSINISAAERLAELPLKCMLTEFPNKLNQTLEEEGEIGTPKELHPAFYGCFDWHSSVHGHWMLVKLLKEYPQMSTADTIRERLLLNITKDNIRGEIEYFIRDSEKGFERTYGWAWLLKLAEEIHTWDDPVARELEEALMPLVDLIVMRYTEFLPKLVYPIRVGEHTNTAFGLTMAYDYSLAVNDTVFLQVIEKRAREFYMADSDCPYKWEPSGYDFISPCLAEADLMRRVLPDKEFGVWLRGFLPDLFSNKFSLEPAKVSDRSDGKLVHLDGLNFSRAWSLYGIASELEELNHLRAVANSHLSYSLTGITDGAYEGEHWLASFAVYALSAAGAEN